MSKIKITSNPYEKQVQYARWDRLSNIWVAIDYQNNPESKLINEDFVSGFFPFQANRILDIAIEEFSDGSLEIEFEGTEDEYLFLCSICEDEKYSSFVTVTRGPRYLENARDIRPDIVSIFRKINPLIMQSVSDKSKIENELSKFTEASNDIVPLCIVGNYSAGKSSFINALIGHEILPSGDEPVTARIYKISPSDHDDRGRIKFVYDGYDVYVRFRGNNQSVDSVLENHPLIEKIKEVIKPLDTVDLVGSINKTLQTINHFEEESLDDNVSDLIEIEVPFDSSMLGNGKTDFVIFDTPGSNSASNVKHFKVLKQAMENMSNGLPIFISEFNSLDSIDNENLFKQIEALDELDHRFTMIVVNKSDKANLPKEGLSAQDEDKILSMSIPKNLYSGGIFFVSSVIALGAKTKGQFYDEFYGEIYDDTYMRFSDPNHKRYKSLYKFNIMPDQLKKDTIEDSEECENLLLVNSGMYSVEQEIKTFATVYSAYNKCIQSELFLGKVYDIATDEIKMAKEEREQSRQYRSDMLNQDMRYLVNRLEKCCEQIKEESAGYYRNVMMPVYKGMDYSIDSEELKNTEVRLKQKYNELIMQAQNQAGRPKTVELLYENTFVEKKRFSVKTLAKNYNNWRVKVAQQSETESIIRKQAADELFGDVKARYQASNASIHTILMGKSIEFWQMRTEDVRRRLVQLVTGSTELDEERKNQLEKMILNYGTIKFEKDTVENMDKDEFEMKLFSIFALDPLNINRFKLARIYNAEIKAAIDGNLRNISIAHMYSFNTWLRDLEEILKSNVIELNPALTAQSQIIKEESDRIQELQMRQEKLNQYVEQIHQMMQWREA